MGKDILSMLPEELEAELVALGEPKFRAAQVFDWIYKKNAASWDDMSNLPKSLRQKCAECLQFKSVRELESVKSDDGTEKILLGLNDNECIEMVVIPAEKRITFCLWRIIIDLSEIIFYNKDDAR